VPLGTKCERKITLRTYGTLLVGKTCFGYALDRGTLRSIFVFSLAVWKKNPNFAKTYQPDWKI